MGAPRDDENPHPRHGYVPKLILAGRLTGTLDGRPVVIEAGESGLVLSGSAIQVAWSARRIGGALVPVLRVLKDLRVPLRMRIAGVVFVEVLPNTNPLARLIAPVLGRLG